jgi:hypothetical protein
VRLADPPPPSLSDPTSNDIDAYMNSQGESDFPRKCVRLADPSPPSLSDPTSNDIDTYINSQGESDILQSTLLTIPHQCKSHGLW